MAGTNISREMYAEAIPACCEYQTASEHEDMLMLCWGLVSSIEQGTIVDCSGCELATRKDSK